MFNKFLNRKSVTVLTISDSLLFLLCSLYNIIAAAVINTNVIAILVGLSGFSFHPRFQPLDTYTLDVENWYILMIPIAIADSSPIICSSNFFKIL